MKYSSVPASRRESRSLLAPVGILLAAGAMIGLDLSRPAPVLASTLYDPDNDLDGLVDKQERILGTNPSHQDSDVDGFLDAEEVARGSSPIWPQFTPDRDRLHVGLTARGERNGLHALIAVYLPDSNYSNVDLHVGVLAGTRIMMLPQALVESRSEITFAPSHAPNSCVALVDFRFDRSWVDANGHLTMFATVGREGSGRITSAGTMDLLNIGGVIALVIPDPMGAPAGLAGGSATELQGTVYKPLTATGSDVPEGWTLGEVCFQQSQVVGVSGAVVTHEVVAAQCDSGWDGSCPASCSSSVGSTYTSVDATSLIGG